MCLRLGSGYALPIISAVFSVHVMSDELDGIESSLQAYWQLLHDDRDYDLFRDTIGKTFSASRSLSGIGDNGPFFLSMQHIVRAPRVHSLFAGIGIEY